MKNVGKAIGYASVTTAAASPERAEGAVWRIKTGEWVDQAGVAAMAVTEADVETFADVGRLQMLAAYVVRVSGVREDGGCLCAVVNGDYVLSEEVLKCHIQYVKKDNPDISMWWSGRKFVVGRRAPAGSATPACVAHLSVPIDSKGLSPVKVRLQGGEWELVGHSRKQDEAKVEAVLQAKPDQTCDPADPKFAATTKLRMGESSESDLNHSIGFHNSKVLAECITDPLATMKQEWEDNGTDKVVIAFVAPMLPLVDTYL